MLIFQSISCPQENIFFFHVRKTVVFFIKKETTRKQEQLQVYVHHAKWKNKSAIIKINILNLHMHFFLHDTL